MDFIITGLPRSRTTWLANFMNTDGVLCYHQALSRSKSLQEYVNDWYITPAWDDSLIVGDAGTEYLVVDVDKWKKDVNTRFVLIDKPKDAVIKSYEKHKDDINNIAGIGKIAFATRQGLDILIEFVELLKKRNDILVIDFYDIDNRLEDIWRYCTHDTKPFNKHRAKELCNFNVQKMWNVGASRDELIDFTNNLKGMFASGLINKEDFERCVSHSGVTEFTLEGLNEDDLRVMQDLRKGDFLKTD